MSDSSRDIAKLLNQVREENRQLRERWSSLKRLILGEWQRGTKMPYSIVKPFIEGNGHAVVTEEEEETPEDGR